MLCCESQFVITVVVSIRVRNFQNFAGAHRCGAQLIFQIAGAVRCGARNKEKSLVRTGASNLNESYFAKINILF